MSKTIKTPSDAIKLFGKNSDLARVLNVRPHTVCTFKVRGLPAHLHLPLWLALQELGYKVDDKELLGYSVKNAKQKLIDGIKGEEK